MQLYLNLNLKLNLNLNLNLTSTLPLILTLIIIGELAMLREAVSLLARRTEKLEATPRSDMEGMPTEPDSNPNSNANPKPDPHCGG